MSKLGVTKIPHDQNGEESWSQRAVTYIVTTALFFQRQICGNYVCVLRTSEKREEIHL